MLVIALPLFAVLQHSTDIVGCPSMLVCFLIAICVFNHVIAKTTESAFFGIFGVLTVVFAKEGKEVPFYFLLGSPNHFIHTKLNAKPAYATFQFQSSNTFSATPMLCAHSPPPPLPPAFYATPKPQFFAPLPFFGSKL